MACSYDERTAARRARLSPEVQQQRAVFAQAYDIAMQVIELREKHGLTQAELAARCGMEQADISRIERGSTRDVAVSRDRDRREVDRAGG